MSEVIVSPKISVNFRIVLGKEVCEGLGANVGDMIHIIKMDNGEYVLRKNLVLA